MKCIFLAFSVVLLASCREKPAPVAASAASSHAPILANLRSAASAMEYRRILAAAPGASALAQEELREAERRMAVMESRAFRAGLGREEIEPEVAAGQKTGAESAAETLAARSTAGEAPEQGEKPAEEKAEEDAGDDGKVK